LKTTTDTAELRREINRLQAEVERLQAAKRRALAVADMRSMENVQLRAEVERLRTATAAPL
jgi:hypothetical protein